MPVNKADFIGFYYTATGRKSTDSFIPEPNPIQYMERSDGHRGAC